MQPITWTSIPDQFIIYPALGPLHFTGHRDLNIPLASREDLRSVQKYISANRPKYRQFIRQKSRFPTIDPYACFQPFNEAFKALYNFVPYLQSVLKDGDIIVNLWDRSGWTATMLAAWFPRQEIWTVWEGDKDILGYKGFDYWMSPDRRDRHTVLFADFTRPLPMASASVAAVIGFDLLHRFHQPDLLKEIHRICKPSAPAIFPHVHLTNNFPDPFFERGCRQLHGKDYEALFTSLEPLTGRTGYVLSEPAAFHNNDLGGTIAQPLTSSPDHNDYNGCIAWLDKNTQPFIQPWRGHLHNWKDHYLLQNPFLSISPLHEIQWNTALYGDSIEELLERHAVYRKRITPAIGKIIPAKWHEILYWSLEGKTVGEIMALTAVDPSFMQNFLEEAWQLDLAQSLPVDEAGFRLQTLLGRQHYILEKKEQQLQAFWKQAVEFFAEETWVQAPDLTLTYEQADELIALTQTALVEEGMRRGDKMMLCTPLHYETLIMFWAAATLGITVIPVSPNESRESILHHVNRCRPLMIFTNPAGYAKIGYVEKVRIVTTDEPDHPSFDAGLGFESLLSKHAAAGATTLPEPGATDIAVILPTTGSTGNPKMIPITHAQLIRSGRLMTETYHWKKADRFYGLGGLETMSGLRHATVSLAEAGATCVIPVPSLAIQEHLAVLQKEAVTIIASNPSFYQQLLLAGRSHKGKKLFPSLRLSLCTGNALPNSVRHQWKERTGTDIYNYYGLTETSGICIAEPLHNTHSNENSIGMPVGCLARVVDDQGSELPYGEPGELCIYGAGNFHGYFDNPRATGEAIRDGWFFTKDLAIMHEDGSISLHGRISDIVKLPTGERLDVAAISEVVATLGLRDVAACPVKESGREYAAVFFVPDEKESAEQSILRIKNAVSEKIGTFAVPRMIVPTDTIPRGNHNKVLRKKLIDQLIIPNH